MVLDNLILMVFNFSIKTVSNALFVSRNTQWANEVLLGHKKIQKVLIRNILVSNVSEIDLFANNCSCTTLEMSY